MQKPLLFFSFLPGAQILSHFLSFSFSLIFYFILSSYMRIFLVFLSVRSLLLVFNQCYVRIVPFVDIFLMHLWGEMNSTSSYSAAILTSADINLKPKLLTVYRLEGPTTLSCSTDLLLWFIELRRPVYSQITSLL